MPKIVVNGATLKCNQGSATSSLTVLPTNRTEGESQPTATVADMIPMTNILPFGTCKSMANPQVASATAAAQGVLTQMPCVPVTAAPWAPGNSKVTINGLPVLTDDSSCMCTWAGKIEVSDPGEKAISTQ